MTFAAWFFLVLSLVFFLLGLASQRSAYRNGIRDGLWNRWLPAVKEIEQEGRWE